ncbi:hypothetical protein B0H11DRAFT_1843504 [Mycena galericulata]|nr:hypothetical protein B0H11DRAFT_1843504 [Mycena galericulata]
MDSPFAQHLHTNYAPSDSEIKWIQSHIEPHTVEVARLNALIQDLSAQRDETQEYIDAHKALLSPVRRLPPDIVQEIFTACLPTQRNAVMSAREAPLLLTCICRAWRALALSTPVLWASLHLPLEFIFDRSPAPAQVRQWLARSGRCALSLSIVGARNMEQWEEDYADEVDGVLQALDECADRWHSIDLSFNMTEGLPRFADVYAPRLVALKLKGPPAEMQSMKLLTTPSLRTVALRIMRDFDRWVPRMPLHWEYLTSLTLGNGGVYQLEGPSPSALLAVLQRCPRLVRFEADVGSLAHDTLPTDTGSEPELLLSTLRVLVFFRRSSSVSPISIHYLLQRLCMPALRLLQLPRMDILHRPIPFLGDLAVRSPLLEELNIDLTGLPHTSLSQTLAGLKHLRKLVVLDCDAPSDGASAQRLLALLAPGSGLALGSGCPPRICPALRELNLQECRDLPGGDAHLLDFARKRLDLDSGSSAGGGNGLVRLEVQFRQFNPPITYALCAPFAERGLTILTSSLAKAYAVGAPEPDSPWSGLEGLED